MPSPLEQKQVNWASFWSLTLIQAMNALNEKGVQFLLIALGIWLSYDLQYSLSVIIVLPFVLFAPLAGWLSDSFCKTRLLQAMVFLQIIVLAGMSVGLFMQNVGVAIGFFCVFCVQAMFFSPAKKGLVKDIVGSENIGFASGILEMSTLLAILVGQIGALFIVYHLLSLWGPTSGWEAAAWPCVVCCIAAIVVFILSLRIPRHPIHSRVPFRKSLLRMLWGQKVLRHSEVGIGYFWFLAGFLMLIALQMAAEANPLSAGEQAQFMRVLGQQKDSALLMVWISGGSIMGGIIASVLCAKKLRLWIAYAGGIGMTIGCALLSVLDFGQPFFYAALAFTGFMGVGFLVPLNAFLQDRADNDKRGDVIAAGNLIDCFFGMVAVGVQFGLKEMGVAPNMQCGLLAIGSLLVSLYVIKNCRNF